MDVINSVQFDAVRETDINVFPNTFTASIGEVRRMPLISSPIERGDCPDPHITAKFLHTSDDGVVREMVSS